MSVAVYIAVVLFSMSTWMDVVGVWIEMPLLVTTLPEGWSLPSYVTIIIQAANVLPLVYFITQKFQERSSKSEANKTLKGLDAEVILTLVIISVAAVNIFVLSFLWPITSFIGGRRHSVVMLSQMIPTAVTSGMTSLVFLPYMARFPSSYIYAHYVGQGFSGLVPGLIGLIQGAGSPPECLWNSTQPTNDTLQNATSEALFDGISNSTTSLIIQSQKPLFSVQIFFLCVTALLLVSLAVFCALNFSKRGRSAMISHHTSLTDTLEVQANNETGESIRNEQRTSLNCETLLEKMDNRGPTGCDAKESCLQSPTAIETPVKMSRGVFIWLLIVIGIVSALWNGLLRATESYTFLPYGYLVYTLAVRLSPIAASLASLLSTFLPRARSVRVVSALTFLGLIIAGFHMILALQSPNPMLRGHLLGDIIVVSKSA